MQQVDDPLCICFRIIFQLFEQLFKKLKILGFMDSVIFIYQNRKLQLQNLLWFQSVQYLVNHSAVKFGNEELIVYWIIDARVTWFDQCYWHSLWITQLIYCRVIDLKSVECGFTQRDATFFTIWSFWSSCKIKMIAFDFILNEKYWSWNWIEDYSYWFEDYNTSKQWKTNFGNYAPQTWSSSCFSSGIVYIIMIIVI